MASLTWLLMGGCGASGTTTLVSGRVTVSGQAMEGGIVSFFPGGGGRPQHTPLDASGAYQVVLPPGNYTVVIQASAQLPEGWKEGDRVPPPRVAPRAIYSQPRRSPLKLTVAADEAQQQDFQLQ
jgi:hypothetical protein